MSPLDTELRHTLVEHAADMNDTPDFWVGIEHRAQVIHRRRVATGGVAGAAVVAAVVVVSVGAMTGTQADRIRVLVPPPSTTARAQSTPNGTLPDGHVPVTEWQPVGTDPTWVRWDAVLASMPDQMPSGFAPLGTPHVVGSGDTDGGAIAVFVVSAGDNLVAAAVLRKAPGVAVAVHDIPADGDVPFVGVVVEATSSSGAVDDGVVVGAPSTGQIEFRLPGQQDFRAVEGGADPRWAAVTLGHVTPGNSVAQVRVLDGDGNTDHPRYTGPIEVGVTFPDV